MCECGPRMICIMFLRRAADKRKEELVTDFLSEDTKPDSADVSTSETTRRHRRHRRSGGSTKLHDRRLKSAKDFYDIPKDNYITQLL